MTDGKPTVANGAFRTAAPGHELRYKTTSGVEKSLHVLATAGQTNRRLSASIFTMEPNEESDITLHSLEDKGYFVIEGDITFNMPLDHCVLTAAKDEFVWHPSGRPISFKAGAKGAKYLLYLVPGTDFVPHFFESTTKLQLDSPEQKTALRKKAFDEYGVGLYENEKDVPKSIRPAASNGPQTPDARVLMPEETDRRVNRPFKSDPSHRYKLNVDRGAMTGVDLVFHSWGHQTGGLFELLDLTWHKPDIVFPHVHTLEEEGFYILEGEFTLYVSEPKGITKVVGRPGDWLWGPRDMPHYYHITGEKGARLICCLLPGGSGFLNFFHGIAVEARGMDLSTPEKFKEFSDWQNKLSAQFLVGPSEWPGEYPSKELALEE
ncbi:hypothetical protein NX059_008723 [Plenodomus lindquistii]|nr:hypothetical protein NX059_008723 [Plenodomus lindquistii]